MTGFRSVLILGSLSAFGPLSIDMYLPALPQLGRDYHAGASVVQLTLTACLAGLALGQLVAGPLSDSLGRRRPLLAGIALYAATSLLCVFAPSVYALVGLRLLQGTAGAAGIVIARAIVRDLHAGEAAARFFSLLMLINGLAPILAPIIGGQLLRVTSWRGIFVALTLIGAALWLGALLGVKETLAPEDRHRGGLRQTGATFALLVRDRTFVGYALALSCGFGAMFAYIAGSSFVLQDIHGVSPQLYSIVFAANALGIVACSQINRALVGRVSLHRLLAAGLVAAACGGSGPWSSWRRARSASAASSSASSSSSRASASYCRTRPPSLSQATGASPAAPRRFSA